MYVRIYLYVYALEYVRLYDERAYSVESVCQSGGANDMEQNDCNLLEVAKQLYIAA